VCRRTSRDELLGLLHVVVAKGSRTASITTVVRPVAATGRPFVGGQKRGADGGSVRFATRPPESPKWTLPRTLSRLGPRRFLVCARCGSPAETRGRHWRQSTASVGAHPRSRRCIALDFPYLAGRFRRPGAAFASGLPERLSMKAAL
jgi:hypothetical protein